MDVIKRYSIAYKGLKPGTHTFEFKVDKSLFETFESVEIRDGACEVKVSLVRSETMLNVAVTISGSVVVPCDRCLEDCTIPVSFEGVLLVKFSNEIREYDGEVMWLSPAEGEVNLAQYIYESIILSLPYQRVHPDGECDSEMLRHLSIVTNEEFAAIEAAAGAEEESERGEWEKLAELKRQMEAEEDGENKKEENTLNL